MRALIGSLVLATALFAGGCGGAQTDAPKVEQGASPAALTIAERTVPDFRMVSAVLTNRDVGDARARIGGRITQILVKEGEKVRAGQVVAVIGDDRISLEADAAARRSEQLKRPASKPSRICSGLSASFPVAPFPRQPSTRRDPERKAAEAQLQAARAQAGAARALNSQGQVVAPSTGEVTRIPSPRGAVIMPGEVVVQITTGAPVLRIELPSSKLQT